MERATLAEFLPRPVHGLLVAAPDAQVQAASDVWIPQEGIVVTIFYMCITLGIVFLMTFLAPTMTFRNRIAARSLFQLLCHIFNWALNLAVLYMFWAAQRWWALRTLVPAHLVIGLLCAYTAFGSCRWKEWKCPALPSCLFTLVVLGFMQGIQFILVYRDYKKKTEPVLGKMGNLFQGTMVTPGEELEDEEEEDDDGDGEQKGLPPFYHCKGLEASFEATLFAYVVISVMVIEIWSNPKNFSTTELLFLGTAAYASVITVGLSVMEVDIRTSFSLERILSGPFLQTARHLAFRIFETTSRIYQIIGLSLFFFSVTQTMWPAYVFMAVDYAYGVWLLVRFGGADQCLASSLILAVPLQYVNLFHFVDSPGMAFASKRICDRVKFCRLTQLVVTVALVTFSPGTITFYHTDGRRTELLRHFIYMHGAWYWLVLFNISGYLVLLFAYAIRVKRTKDLHQAVFDGDGSHIQQLLELQVNYLDVNRPDPFGWTPLHLATALEEVDCMHLLIEGRANITAHSLNSRRDTALHLAAMNEGTKALELLVNLDTMADFLNAKNADGDTALHVAAKFKKVDALEVLLLSDRVDVQALNAHGQTVAEAALGTSFGFDQDSQEAAIAESLRRITEGQDRQQDQGSFLAQELVVMQNSIPRPPKPPQEVTHFAGPFGRVNSEKAVASGFASHRLHVQRLQTDQEVDFIQNFWHPEFLGSLERCTLSTFMLSTGLSALSTVFLAKAQRDMGSQNFNNTIELTETAEKKTSLEDFVTLKQIGEGSFGKVVKVMHKHTGEVFAMKMLDKPQFYYQEQAKMWADSEQYILKTTRHPFIVSLHYSFQSPTLWFLVMDYCPNKSLQNLLEDYGDPGLPIPEVARYCGEMLLAIAHLHSISVIFRDLKLDNVVIDSNWRARITDFGLAKKLTFDNSSDAKTFCGTYGYTAPEIMSKQGGYTFGVDLYALGVMLYMMLSGGEVSIVTKRREPPKTSHFRSKLKGALKDSKQLWAAPEVEAHDLIRNLTTARPDNRPDAEQAQAHPFFPKALGRNVKNLLKDQGPFGPPGESRTARRKSKSITSVATNLRSPSNVRSPS